MAKAGRKKTKYGQIKSFYLSNEVIAKLNKLGKIKDLSLSELVTQLINNKYEEERSNILGDSTVDKTLKELTGGEFVIN